MLAVMQFLLESSAVQPINVTIGVVVFVVLLAAMAALHGFGAGRPHS